MRLNKLCKSINLCVIFSTSDFVLSSLRNRKKKFGLFFMPLPSSFRDKVESFLLPKCISFDDNWYVEGKDIASDPESTTLSITKVFPYWWSGR